MLIGQKHLNFCVSSKAAVSLCITEYKTLRGIDVVVSFSSSSLPVAQRSPLPLQDSPLCVVVPQDLVSLLIFVSNYNKTP